MARQGFLNGDQNRSIEGILIYQNDEIYRGYFKRKFLLRYGKGVMIY